MGIPLHTAYYLAAQRGIYGPEIQDFARALRFLYIGIPFTPAPVLAAFGITTAENVSWAKTVLIIILAIIPANALFALLIR